MSADTDGFWSMPPARLLSLLQTSEQGLTTAEARRRLTVHARSRLSPSRHSGWLWILLAQYRSPIILILVFASFLSLFVHDFTDAAIILCIVAMSGLLSFSQEARAAGAVRQLIGLVRANATVVRDTQEWQVPVETVVPGDVVLLSAGAHVPADGVLLDSNNLYVSEAALTGETYPVEKAIGPLPVQTPLGQRRNVLFMGTNVVSGMGRAVVVHTGRETEFGKISERLRGKPPETEFERGLRRFGYFLMELTLLLVVAIFAINTYFGRPALEAFLFSLALAVGLTPQLLPAIVGVNLAHGARDMAKAKVIVKRLSAIEDFGSMNVLCSDKTGTLTQGTIHLEEAIDARGQPSQRALSYSYLNASLESGFVNPIDEAIRSSQGFDITAYAKLGEVPYDFIRKRLSILVSTGTANVLISKGAVPNILQLCSHAELADGTVAEISGTRERITGLFEDAGRKGRRAIAVAYRDLGSETSVTKQHEMACERPANPSLHRGCPAILYLP